jgi:cytosine deaminase
MDQVYNMVTRAAGRAMGLPDFELKVGAPAHLVVLHAHNVIEALRFHEAPAVVVSHGRVVDTEAMRALIHENEP